MSSLILLAPNGRNDEAPTLGFAAGFKLTHSPRAHPLTIRARVHYTSPQEDTSHEPRPGKTYAQLVPAKDESRDQLFQAMNDYSTMFQNLKYAERYEKLRERLSDWPARPELPERRWPRDGEDSGT